MEEQARPGVFALLPAHDEQDNIGASLASLAAQTRPPAGVVVIADNCSDGTAAVAVAAGASVLTTVGNTDRKAGALNQALAVLLPAIGPDELVLAMDADGQLAPQFLAQAVAALAADPALGAVGGVFYADRPGPLVARLQANEYRRYARTIAQRGGRVSVLSGTAAVFRSQVLRQLLATRGQVYDPQALTEDNELTLAIKTLGWGMISPSRCVVTTQVMPRWRDLWVQRLRWYRGAIDNLAGYGWTPVTARYWWQQIGLAASTLAVALYLVLTVWTIASGTAGFSVFWSGVGVAFAAERVATVWGQGVRARLLAALLVPEFGYDLFLQCAFLAAVGTALTRRDVRWVHPHIG